MRSSNLTNLRMEDYVIPSVELGEKSSLPIFKNEHQNFDLEFTKSVPEEDKKYIGWGIGFKVLPYRLQDNYDRKLKQKVYTSIILENDFLKATFLPQLGGRLVSLIYKLEGKELLEHNPVIYFANMSARKCWWSSGAEWNTGPYSHHYHTAAPIFAARIIGTQGEPALRLYEFERQKRIAWQIDFHLPPDSKFLYAKIKTINTTDHEIPMFWWTCIAVPETDETRIIAPADSTIFLDMNIKGYGFDFSKLPIVSAIGNKDITYPINLPCASATFLRVLKNQRPWITALDKNGRGLIETSTRRFFGRKFFSWGNHVGARNWQQYLSIPGRNGYIEIQAGLTRTQEEMLPMGAHSKIDWTEAFGYMEAKPEKIHSSNYEVAWKTVDKKLSGVLPEEEVNEMDCRLSELADLEVSEIMTEGSGWGALEKIRLKENNKQNQIPKSFLFAENTIGPEQKKWINILKKKPFPTPEPEDKPGDWMIQPEWRNILEISAKGQDKDNWFAWLHLGVMYMENGEYDKAQNAWEVSIQKKPSCWAYRNLSQIAIRKNNIEEMCFDILKAWEIAIEHGHKEIDLAAECLEVLYHAKKYEKAKKFIAELPKNFTDNGRISILQARFALIDNDFATVEKILEREYEYFEEKGSILVEIWYSMWEKRLAAKQNREINDKIREKVRKKHPPPSRIDYRSGREGYLIRKTFYDL